MITNDDIEIYLDKCGFPFEKLDEGLWKVSSPEDMVENILVNHVPPTVTITINLMKLPKVNREVFFKKLLEINATQITHGGFGIDEENLILIDNLESENLDLNEIKASIQSIAFTTYQYYKEFKDYI